MGVKLNAERSFVTPVPMAWLDEDGKQQEGVARAKFRVMSADELEHSENSGKRFLDIILLQVMDLEMIGDAGQVLEGDELLEAAKVDPVTGGALVEAYSEANKKKPSRKTSRR